MTMGSGFCVACLLWGERKGEKERGRWAVDARRQESEWTGETHDHVIPDGFPSMTQS